MYYSTCGQLCHLYGGGWWWCDDDLYCHQLVTFIIRLVQGATLTTWDLLLLTMYYNEIYNVSILVTLMSRSSLNYPTSVGGRSRRVNYFNFARKEVHEVRLVTCDSRHSPSLDTFPTCLLSPVWPDSSCENLPSFLVLTRPKLQYARVVCLSCALPLTRPVSNVGQCSKAATMDSCR